MSSLCCPGKAKSKFHIILVDDHPVVRQGLALLVDQEPDLKVCGQAQDTTEAMNIVRKTRPDLVVVDISLAPGSGLELIKDIKIVLPDCPVLVLSMHDERFYAERALKAGARGYVMKQESTETILGAIRHVLSGRVYLSQAMQERMLNQIVSPGKTEDASPMELLSDRELEVFNRIGLGMSTKEIADDLRLSTKTVETYRMGLKKKLKISSSPELMHNAIKWLEKSRN